MKYFFLVISILISLFIDFNIFFDKYQHGLILLWILSICLLFCIFYTKTSNTVSLKKYSIKKILIFIIILLPVMVRIAFLNPARFHTDDLITAYFSATYDFKSTNFFSGIPNQKVEWVSQFPTTYFILQRLFFTLFGESLVSVKLSVLPYVFICSLFLFLIGKEIFNTKVASLAVFVYGFFAISLYLETLGLHFIASTAVYLIFYYCALRWYRSNTSYYANLTGITCGLSYLFYTTSYIAFPIFIVFSLFHLIKNKNKQALKTIAIGCVALFITLGPFLTYTFRFDNYFLSRMKQVSLLNGEWSGMSEKIASGESKKGILYKNISESIQSLYIDGIGGHGGYTFANFALFERTHRVMIILGSILGLILLFKKSGLFAVFLTITLSFCAMIFSIPPPAFQRVSLAFPFVALLSSLPFYFLLQIKHLPKTLTICLITIFLIFYAVENQTYFIKATQRDVSQDDLSLGLYINTHFPKRNIYIASFPGFAFEKIYYFIPGKSALSIHTDYHDNLIRTFNPKEKYVYVIIFPDYFGKKFLQLDNNGKIIHFSSTYDLFVNW